METQHLSLVVRAAEQNFPATIRVQDQTLHRQVIAIDSQDHRVDTSSGCLSHYADRDATERLLWELVEMLDHNLGSVYARVTRELYHNTRPWRINKWDEMLTRGLVYVVYVTRSGAATGRRRRGRSTPLLFLSFMLTEENGLIHSDPARVWSVLYLYEIQLLPCVRGRGLGHTLVSEYLAGTARAVREGARMTADQFFGVELTVFGENDGAIRFYRRLGMRRAADSPEERHDDVISQKPLYYLYVMRIDNVPPGYL
ncbi:hypothetical protein HG536_0A04600 [Torulaspora globosa]|uniref:N-alpha-acetyltransferase 40 n=1 Tax=Torulaspora globosa TaxID=48254 RepID=A0A7G3ZAV7_9SACH|nr:uncharacterized protein HG536_0A04600 [Torulaspora globosa]QLL30643.1 hypothetical protein HG536_0A04600 [Torulaspora globosa]